MSTEAFEKIYCFLDYKDILRTSQTCRSAYEASLSERVWLEQGLRKYTFFRPKSKLKSLFKDKVVLKETLKGNPSDYMMMPCLGHRDYISCLSVWNEGVITGSNNGEVFVWVPEYEEGYMYVALQKHLAPIQQLQTENHLLAVLSTDGVINVWALVTPEFDLCASFEIQNSYDLEIKLKDHKVLVTGQKNSQTNLWVLCCQTGTALFNTQVTPSCLKADLSGSEVFGVSEFSVFKWNWKTKTLMTQKETQQTNPLSVGVFSCKVVTVFEESILVYNSFLLCVGKVSLSVLCVSMVENTVCVQTNLSQVEFYKFSNKLEKIGSLSLDNEITGIASSSYNYAVVTRSNNVYVCDKALGRLRYELPGQPFNQPKYFVGNPGDSCLVNFDNSKIALAFGNLLRVYSFDN